MDKIIELAKKLNELHKRGVGGESKNAKELLDKLMSKHGITPEDIEGEKVSDHYFNLKEEINVQLMLQIAKCLRASCKVYHFDKKTVRQYKLEGNVLIECTAAEFIQISQMFELYSNLYKKEFDIFFMAFLKSNDLLIKAPKEETKSLQDLTKEELEDYLRMSKIAENITKASVVKRLES